MSALYLIRHGQASFGTDDYDRLSELGRRQAAVLGGYLRDSGISFDAVISGDLSRQRDTAEIASGRVPDKIDPRFNEIENDLHFQYFADRMAELYPDLQPLMADASSNSRSYQLILRRIFHHWVTTDEEIEGMQTWEAYLNGAWSALQEVMSESGRGVNVAVFTSGGTIATLVAKTLGLTGTGTYQFYEPMVNCSVTRILFSGDQMALQYYNDHSFFQVLGAQSGEQLVTYR